MSEEKNRNDDDNKHSIGYKLGEAFGAFLILCAMFVIGAVTIGSIVKFLRWMF